LKQGWQSDLLAFSIFSSLRKGSAMASFHHHLRSGKKGTGADHAAYITRRGRYSHRGDLIQSGYGNMPAFTADNPFLFWRAGDRYERSNGAVYREHEIALPAELTRAQQLELAGELVRELVGIKPYQYAIHTPASSLEGKDNTHLHLMFSDRLPDGIERSPEQIFRRYNPKQPELGGAKKASGGRNRMEVRDEMLAMRRTSAELQNAALEKHGHTARVDHRTLKAQGVEKEPERHLGPARIRNMTAEDKERYVAGRKSGR
jgi:hypothetical protein